MRNNLWFIGLGFASALCFICIFKINQYFFNYIIRFYFDAELHNIAYIQTKYWTKDERKLISTTNLHSQIKNIIQHIWWNSIFTCQMDKTSLILTLWYVVLHFAVASIMVAIYNLNCINQHMSQFTFLANITFGCRFLIPLYTDSFLIHLLSKYTTINHK